MSGYLSPLFFNTFSNSFILSVSLLLYFSKWCYWEEIGRFKNWGAILEDVFPEILLSIVPTTDFLGMLVLRCETNPFDIFLQIWRTVERNEHSKSNVANNTWTHGVTDNIKTNTSPGGLADHHSRQPKLLKSFYVIVFLFWYTSMLSPSFELIFAFLLVQF